MDIILQLEGILQQEYGLSLEYLHTSEEVCFINMPVGYGSRVYTLVKGIGEENLQERRPQPCVDGIFYAGLMRHNADPNKLLITIWRIVAWKGDNYLLGLRFYTNDEEYLITRMLQTVALKDQRKYMQEAFDSLPSPKIMG